MNTFIKKMISFVLALTCIMGATAITPRAAYASVPWPSISSSKPIKAYTRSTGRYIQTYNSNMKAESGRYLWDTDELFISSVANGRITYTYPSGNTRRTSYNYLSLVTAASAPVEVNTSRAKITSYRRYNGAETCGYVAVGDRVYKLTEQGGRTQVLYNIGSVNNPSGWRMAWIPTTSYNNYVKPAKQAADTLKISNQTAPGTITEGSGFTIQGTISSNYKITKVTVGIYNANGQAVSTKTVTPNAYTYNVNSIDSYIHFSYAKPGTNYYRVYAWTSVTNQKLLQNNAFTVKAKQAPVTSGSWSYPMTNAYVCGNNWAQYYSKRPTRPYHAGLDLASKTGDANVYAASGGKVVGSGYNNANGNYVIIQHSLNGQTVYSFYCHLSSRSVSVNKTVTKGKKIGVYGNTGTASAGRHLHFAITTSFSSTGGYVGYGDRVNGNRVTYNGVTFYNPAYVIANNKLP